jgi:hypothetical protein
MSATSSRGRALGAAREDVAPAGTPRYPSFFFAVFVPKMTAALRRNTTTRPAEK